jgi:hypothetical protein
MNWRPSLRRVHRQEKVVQWTKPQWNQWPRMMTSGKQRDARGISLVIPHRQPRIWRTSPNIHICQAASKSSVNSQLLHTSQNYWYGHRNYWSRRVPKNSGRPPPAVMTSTTNLIWLQNDLKEHIKGEYEFRNTRNGTRIITKEMVDYSAMKTYLEKSHLP